MLGKNGRLCFEKVLGRGAIMREVGGGSDVPMRTLFEGRGSGKGTR